MTSINPLSIAPAQQSPDSKKASGDVLDKDSFMKLLVEQLRNQAPDNKSDPQAFINQMTQFSILEQLQNQSAADQQQNAAGLLGRTVSYLNDAGASVEGLVDAVDYNGGVPTLSVAGQAGIAPAKVYRVR